jgi:hypothetical protein
MVSGPTGPFGIAVLFLLGWIFVENNVVKYTCGALLLSWFGFMIWLTIANRALNILIFPGIIAIAWSALSGVKNLFGSEI